MKHRFLEENSWYEIKCLVIIICWWAAIGACFWYLLNFVTRGGK
jgi:hypothetical protein